MRLMMLHGFLRLFGRQKIILVFCLVSMSLALDVRSESGEIGYGFLTTEMSAYDAAQGGRNVLLKNDGANVVFSNPAMISEKTDGEATLTYHRYLSETGVLSGNMAYGWTMVNEHFAAGVKYVDYGDFDGYDEVGNYNGKFSAQDLALTIGWARSITDVWSVGVALKPAFSHYEDYNSFALMFDAGLSYDIRRWNLDFGLALQNVGVQVFTYKDERERLPMNLAMTMGKNFEHAPFRVWMTWYALNDWDFDYVSNGENAMMGKNEKVEPEGWRLLFEHSLWGADLFLINDMLRLSVSYNVRRAQELKLADGEKSMAGFALGGGINLKKLTFDIGAAQYQSGVWSWSFTIKSNLNQWKKNRE